jgi:hypothetical protein
VQRYFYLQVDLIFLSFHLQGTGSLEVGVAALENVGSSSSVVGHCLVREWDRGSKPREAVSNT